jgi:hypothetical protein
MSYQLQVFNSDKSITWQKSLNEEEFTKVQEYTKGENKVSLFYANLVPVRTNNFHNFSKDLFLPLTLRANARKVNDSVGSYFLLLAALVFDLLTFPIRLITAIPRVISNPKKEDNLFYKYLLTQNVDKKLLELDLVKVSFEWESKIEKSIPKTRIIDGDRVQTYSNKISHHEEKDVNFIELPFEDSGRYSAGTAQ